MCIELTSGIACMNILVWTNNQIFGYSFTALWYLRLITELLLHLLILFHCVFMLLFTQSRLEQSYLSEMDFSLLKGLEVRKFKNRKSQQKELQIKKAALLQSITLECSRVECKLFSLFRH